jgi:hypothetical protein
MFVMAILHDARGGGPHGMRPARTMNPQRATTARAPQYPGLTGISQAI